MNTLPSDFNAFCDFVTSLRATGDHTLTPEESVVAFRQLQQEQLRVWNERNAISQEQARRGEYGPLDDEAVIARLRKRLAEHGITD